MPFFLNLLTIVQILTAIVMIGLILLQHGKGADMGASFGSGASGSLFGATGSANALSRATAICATLFFVITLALAYFAQKPGNAGVSTDVLEQLAKPNPATSSVSIPVAPVAPVSAPPAAPAKPASGVDAIPK